MNTLQTASYIVENTTETLNLVVVVLDDGTGEYAEKYLTTKRCPNATRDAVAALAADHYSNDDTRVFEIDREDAHDMEMYDVTAAMRWTALHR